MFSPSRPREAEVSEGAGVEDYRDSLLREYGFALVREQYAIYVRVPRSRVIETNISDLDHLDKALKKTLEAIASRTTTAFLIADQDFVELDTDRFLFLISQKEPGPIQEAVQDSIKGLASSRDPRLRRIIEELSEERQRSLLESVRRSGRSGDRLTSGRRGRVVAYHPAPPEGTQDVALFPTIRSAVLRGSEIGAKGRLEILKQDIQENIRYTRVGSYMCLIVDTSSYDDEVQEQSRSVVKSLLLDAYERRDQVALILSRGNRAQIASDFTSDLELIRSRFLSTTWGGLSPFSSGIQEATKIFLARLADTIEVVRLFVLITTGKANVPLVQGGNVRRELTFLPNVFEQIHLPPLVVDVTPHGAPFLRDFARQSAGRYYHPSTVRYHKVSLAQQFLKSAGTGDRDTAAAVGKAFLSKLNRTTG